MPQRDTFHDAVKNALVKEGWTITHDPLVLAIGIHKMFVDLGAERLLAAERGGERIAVEIKSFVGYSDVAQLEDAVGQYVIYRIVLSQKEPERRLVLAVPAATFETLMQTELGRAVCEETKIELLAFDPQQEVVTRWVK